MDAATFSQLFLTAIVAAAALGAIAIVTLFLTRDVRFRRRMERIARTPIADARVGLVKVTGKLRLAGRRLHAPDGEPCAWYRAGDKEAICDFELEDETGVALVRARGAEILVLSAADLLAEGARVTVVGEAARDEVDPAAAPAGYRQPAAARLTVVPVFIALVAG